MVHGLAEDRHTWSNQQAALGDFHTFAYDLRGHGDTTVGAADATLAQLGGDLVGFLEQVSGPAIVVGFSLGGTVALWAATHRPDLVRQAVVLGTSSVVGRTAAGFYQARIEMAADTASPEFAAALRDDTAAGLAVATEQLDRVVAARLAAVGDGVGYCNAAKAMAGLHQDPLTPSLATLSAHVDVVGAAHDTFCPLKAAQIILDALPDGHYHEISDAGHLVNIDNPRGVTEVLRVTLNERN
ncbi:MAG: alpha/beta hydrolase [Intrasporangium sp.]|uniref:alpha/beta fold hydrolase n=1 Tax=Intrasporangium sp. TaxID=1925024 RepID=UPI0026499CF2|nr:alpha/beta hydrolase [Intrasporangium sp.]MDN5794127.1 alpha/beta hydrolase [Intrasporangium sp.]